MPKLKLQLHIHTKQDPVDGISHTEKQMIDRAATLQYNVLAITCHNVLIHSEELQKYAASKNILLIPALEKSVEKKHVLILNATVAAQTIQTFDDLRTYRKNHPESFCIAAHPFYGHGISLGKKLEEHIDLFDAIEYSWFHSKKMDRFNTKAIEAAEKHGKPVIGTSDNHLLRYFDQTYSVIETEKHLFEKLTQNQKTATPLSDQKSDPPPDPKIAENLTKLIFKTLKEGKITIVSHPLPLYKLPLIGAEMLLRKAFKHFLLR